MRTHLTTTALALACLALTGCAAKVVQATSNMVQVEHGASPRGFNGALEAANQSCSTNNKVAAIGNQACHGPRCTTQFRCESR